MSQSNDPQASMPAAGQVGAAAGQVGPAAGQVGNLPHVCEKIGPDAGERREKADSLKTPPAPVPFVSQDGPVDFALGADGYETARADPAVLAAAAEILKRRRLPEELAQDGGNRAGWHWQGYVGAGKMTLLTSQWKSGKTTLVSVLLARMLKGGELAGLPVTAGQAAVFTEEESGDWDERCRKLGITNYVSLFCRPFAARPTKTEWRGLVSAMLELRRREGLALVVVDPLAVFLPGNENTAGGMMECLLPLRELTSAGLGVLLLHHPRKGRCPPGQAARGSGALHGHVDIMIEMDWFGPPDELDRRRLLRAYSRHEATRRHLVVELTADGTDYLVHDLQADEAGSEGWRVLQLVLEDASERLTQRQILEQWPEDFRKPDQGTISRLLRRGVALGVIGQRGSGRRNDPYLYWLPRREEDFHPGPDASDEEVLRWNRRRQEKWAAALQADPRVRRMAAAAAARQNAATALTAAPLDLIAREQPASEPPAAVTPIISEPKQPTAEPCAAGRTPEAAARPAAAPERIAAKEPLTNLPSPVAAAISRPKQTLSKPRSRSGGKASQPPAAPSTGPVAAASQAEPVPPAAPSAPVVLKIPGFGPH
jgi:AAA domain